MMKWCEKAFEMVDLELWPSQPFATPAEAALHPGMVQCLALADAKQCDALVQSCLSRLQDNPGSDGIIRSALASRQMSRLIHGLRSETKSSVIQLLARIPTVREALGIISVYYFVFIPFIGTVLYWKHCCIGLSP